jgi:hypothetical protein
VVAAREGSGDDSATDFGATSASASPQLNILNVSLMVRGTEATITWKVGGDFDKQALEPDVAYTWIVFLHDNAAHRRIIVNRGEDRMVAFAQFDTDLRNVDLPEPLITGSTMTLTVRLKTLRWDGKRAEWFAVTGYHKRDGGQNIDADRVPDRGLMQWPARET